MACLNHNLTRTIEHHYRKLICCPGYLFENWGYAKSSKPGLFWCCIWRRAAIQCVYTVIPLSQKNNTYVCTYTYIYIYIHIIIYIYMIIYIYIYIHIIHNIYVYIYNICILYSCVYIYIYTYLPTYILYIHIDINTYT